MAYYGYYQQQLPYWGQQSYASQMPTQFINPPQPTYQPQPNWTGVDYYNAHYGAAGGGAYESDSGMFDWVWDRLKSLVGSKAASRRESQSWHSRVYGGLVDITSLLPADLGAAAGYEVYRLFKTYNSIYAQPLSGDRERQEEALTGLAIAEATKLWSYCQRPGDKYGRRESCEVSAATAERLWRRALRRARDDDYEEYAVDDGYIDNSDSDDNRGSRRGYRSRRGSRSDGRRRRSSVNYGTYAQPGANALAIPGALGATAGGYVPTYGGAVQAVGGVQYAGASPGLSSVPMGGVNYAQAGYQVQQPGVGVGIPVSPYQQATYLPAVGAAGGLGVPQAGYGGAGGMLGVPGGGRQRSSSFTYQASPGYY